MKKIMFNDRYGLTEVVLTGRKTMTRRIVNQKGIEEFATNDTTRDFVAQHYATYKVGEVVAIAQSYRTIYDELEEKYGNSKANEWWCKLYDYIGDGLGPAVTPGYRNKMFARADFMLHHVQITDVKIERLRYISDEDCMKEGIRPSSVRRGSYEVYERDKDGSSGTISLYTTPRNAFSSLIDRISGKGTWECNPWVFVYTFELID